MYYADQTGKRLENYNTRNLPELLGLGSAIDFRNLIGGGLIEGRVRELKNYLRGRMGNRPYLKIKTPAHESLSAGITVVEVDGWDAKTVQKRLVEEFRIDCRAMTAHELNGLRISTSYYNTKDEIDRLIEALDVIYG